MAGRIRFEYVLATIILFSLFSIYQIQINLSTEGSNDVLLEWAQIGAEFFRNMDRVEKSADIGKTVSENLAAENQHTEHIHVQPIINQYQSEEVKELIKKKKIRYALLSRNVSSNENCKHTIHRDYNKKPVIFYGNADMPNCDIPCVGNGPEPDIGGPNSCSHSKSYERTMENSGRHVGDFKHIAGNSHLNSDVPIQYFSWAEYTFMRPPEQKTQTSAMAAFISNCGPQYRLKVLKTIMDAGLLVDSMGTCMNNKKSIASNNGGGRLVAKIQAIANYKFTFAFENSETDDYVTEKLFGALAAGSVPVYYGAPNAYKFAPSNKSIIFAQDFKTPEDLANYLILLDKNDTLYNEYLQWKFDGPNKDWIALMDLSIVHSNCRFCIRSADIDRVMVGEVVTGPFEHENREEMKKYSESVALMVKIRERGKFWLRRIHLEILTLSELKTKILEKYNDKEKGDIHSVYKLWDRERKPITSDGEVRELDYGEELEIIFENPGSLERGSYTKWWYQKYRNQKVTIPEI